MDSIETFFPGLAAGSTTVDTGSAVVDGATDIFGQILGTIGDLFGQVTGSLTE